MEEEKADKEDIPSQINQGSVMVYNTLNRLKWTGKLRDCRIIILHRGAPGDRKVIEGGQVTEVKRSYFMYENDKEVFIPLHRVLEIKLEGKTLWKREQEP